MSHCEGKEGEICSCEGFQPNSFKPNLCTDCYHQKSCHSKDSDAQSLIGKIVKFECGCVYVAEIIAERKDQKYPHQVRIKNSWKYPYPVPDEWIFINTGNMTLSDQDGHFEMDFTFEIMSEQRDTMAELLYVVENSSLRKHYKELLIGIITNKDTLTEVEIDEGYRLPRFRGTVAGVSGVGLATNTTLTSFILYGAQIGDHGAVTIGEGLKANATLTKLKLEWCDIGDIGAGEMGASLTANTTLTELNLKSNLIRGNGAVAIGEGLAANTTLTNLSLARNKIGENGASEMGSVLAANTTLTELDLSFDRFGEKGAVAIGKGLATNTTITKLNLASNAIGENGAVAIGEGLTAHTTLAELDISYNAIGENGASVIGNLLTTNAALTRLNLSRTDIGDSGADAIRAGLAANNTLAELDISHNKIGDHVAAAFGALLTTNTALAELNISWNNIGSDGGDAIGAGLAGNRTLTKLDISFNKIGDVGASGIGAVITTNTTLTELDLRRNFIGDVGCSEIAAGIGSNMTLTWLDIQQNNIGDIGAGSIGGALFSNTECILKYFNIDDNDIKSTGFLSLAKGMRKQNQLIKFSANENRAVHLDGCQYERSLIGEGQFGRVELVHEKRAKSRYVEKTSKVQNSREELYETLILQGLPKHANVIKFAESRRFSRIKLRLEVHGGGSLKEFAKKHKGGPPLSSVFRYSRHMALALEHLHLHGLLHRDLALRNFVLTDDLLRAILIDFGLSYPIEQEEFVEIQPEDLMPWRQCGPEILTTLRYSKGSDVWMLGLCFWQFIQRAGQPFSIISNSTHLADYLRFKMVDKNCPIPLRFRNKHASAQLTDAIREIVVFCCSYDVAKRPTARAVVEKIDAMQEVSMEEEKEIEAYKPDEDDIKKGIEQYNYSDYDLLETDGQRNYIDLYEQLQDDECEKLGDLANFEDFVELDVEDLYQKIDSLPPQH